MTIGACSDPLTTTVDSMAADAELELDIREIEGGVRIAVRAQPGASRRGVVGAFRRAVKVAVHAAPEKGAANKEIVAVLAKTLGVSRSRVRLVSGETARDKVVAVEDLSLLEARDRLRRALAGESP